MMKNGVDILSHAKGWFHRWMIQIEFVDARLIEKENGIDRGDAKQLPASIIEEIFLLIIFDSNDNQIIHFDLLASTRSAEGIFNHFAHEYFAQREKQMRRRVWRPIRFTGNDRLHTDNDGVRVGNWL